MRFLVILMRRSVSALRPNLHAGACLEARKTFADSLASQMQCRALVTACRAQQRRLAATMYMRLTTPHTGSPCGARHCTSPQPPAARLPLLAGRRI
jgi:hypothetical protein